MQDEKKAPGTGRIDLSNCKLLSVYGLSTTDILKGGPIKAGPGKIGTPVKAGFVKIGLARPTW